MNNWIGSEMNNPGKILRRMGYLRDQEGIMNRYLREREHWADHLEKTKAFINGSFEMLSAESVAVLGSGWLLDIPLRELESRFSRVYLVDIIHPPQVRKKTESMDRVELVEADLTGGAVGQVWQISREKGSHSLDNFLQDLQLTSPITGISPGAVISVNLLNQLDIILCDFLQKQGTFGDEPLDRFRSVIQSFHLEWIMRTPGCLVTDATEKSRDHQGNESFKPLLYTRLPEGIRTGQWSWEFDTRGTYRSGIRTSMEVQAVEWR